MSLFQTSSSLLTVNSNDNYLSFTPCHIKPSVIDHKGEIYHKNREGTAGKVDSDVSLGGLQDTLEAYYQNSSNKIHKRLFDFNFKSFGSRILNASQQQQKVSEQENYENALIKRLTSAKNDSEALHVMSKLWKSVRFCDLILVISNVQYLAHRVILALYSQKYRSYFRQHKHDFVTRITLKESKPRALQQILRFLYSKEEIRFNIKSIDSILTCVKELGLSKLQETCEKSLHQFEKKYVFELSEISSKHGLKQLYAETFLYICLHFNDCIEYPSFLNASYRLLVDILEREAIRDRDEVLLLQQLIEWITRNKDFLCKNPDNASRMLRTLNFAKIPLDVLRNAKNNNLFILQLLGCEFVFNEAIRSMRFQSSRNSDVKSVRERTLSVEVPRKTSRKKDSRLVYGVEDRKEMAFKGRGF